MKGQKIINKFFKQVHQQFALGIPNFDDDVDNNLYDFDEIIDEFRRLPAFNAIGNIPAFIQNFGNDCFNPDFLTEHYTRFQRAEIINFTQPAFKKRNRSFYYFDNEFGYFSLKKAIEEDSLGTLFTEHIQALSTIQEFISSCIVSRRMNEVENLLNFIESGNKNVGVILQKTNQRRDSIFIYSFTYFRHLCKGGVVEMDENLKYKSIQPFNPHFVAANKYSQFFEIFDVVNEINHSKDILTRFLKVYHVLEYLSYRVKLVKVEEAAREGRTFIRSISSISSAAEENSLIKCFDQVFRLDKPTIITKLNLTLPQKSFIESKLEIPLSEINGVNFIPKLIYKLRNSIVHNKESELHITISNPSEYRKIVSIMHRLIVILEEVIFRRINEPQPKINYHSATIELF